MDVGSLPPRHSLPEGIHHVSGLNYYTSSPQRLMTPHFSRYLSPYLLISIPLFASIVHVNPCTLGFR